MSKDHSSSSNRWLFGKMFFFFLNPWLCECLLIGITCHENELHPRLPSFCQIPTHESCACGSNKHLVIVEDNRQTPLAGFPLDFVDKLNKRNDKPAQYITTQNKLRVK